MKRSILLALLGAILIPTSVTAAYGTVPAADWCRAYLMMSQVIEQNITDRDAWQSIYNDLDDGEVGLCTEIVKGFGAQSVVYEFERTLAPEMTQSQGVNGMFNGTGTYIVGTDIEPGTYRASGHEGCHWARLSDFEGGVIDSSLEGRSVVTIEPSDAGFRTNDCGTWGPVQ